MDVTVSMRNAKGEPISIAATAMHAARLYSLTTSEFRMPASTSRDHANMGGRPQAAMNPTPPCGNGTSHHFISEHAAPDTPVLAGRIPRNSVRTVCRSPNDLVLMFKPTVAAFGNMFSAATCLCLWALLGTFTFVDLSFGPEEGNSDLSGCNQRDSINSITADAAMFYLSVNELTRADSFCITWYRSVVFTHA